MSTTHTSPESVRASRPLRILAAVVLATLVAVVGRGIAVDGSDSAFVRWLPWLDRTSVTFFFADSSGEYLVPVTRTVSQDEASPEALMDAYLAGPADGSGLVSPIPAGTEVSSVLLDGGDLTVDLAGTYGSQAPFLAHEALYQSMRMWPDVETVTVRVDGALLETNTTGHLLYYYDEPHDRLVAQVTNQVRPGDVLLAWLEGPSDPDLIGLPDDIQAIGVELGANDLLTLEFTFQQSLRDFAVDHPESVRRVLEGLIATFNTGFPEVEGVMLDFEGRNALGLGQCANLLNTVQTMPETLNDERILARYAGA